MKNSVLHQPTKKNESIFARLKGDHQELKRLCALIIDEESGATATAKKNFEKLRVLLSSHAKAEEKVFYTLLKKRSELDHNDDLKDIVLEGFEEHHVADFLLRELSSLDASDERWMAKMKVLSENLKHHIKEEEQEMFAEARDELIREETLVLTEKFVDKQTEIARRL